MLVVFSLVVAPAQASELWFKLDCVEVIPWEGMTGSVGAFPVTSLPPPPCRGKVVASVVTVAEVGKKASSTAWAAEHKLDLSVELSEAKENLQTSEAGNKKGAVSVRLGVGYSRRFPVDGFPGLETSQLSNEIIVRPGDRRFLGGGAQRSFYLAVSAERPPDDWFEDLMSESKEKLHLLIPPQFPRDR
jgi:hypothetical protein